MKSGQNLLADLRALPCLAGLTDGDLAAVGATATQMRFRKNEMIFEDSAQAEFFFIVANGSVKLYKTSAEGRELLIRIMRQGDYFCCAPLYGSGSYSVNAVSLEPSTLVVIPANRFKEILGSGTSTIGLKIIAGLCARIRTLSNLVEDVTFKDVEQRVMLVLLRLAEEKSSKGKNVSLSVTHQDIASMTGTVREVVSRTMSRLKKDGIILGSSTKSFEVDKARLSQLLRK